MLQGLSHHAQAARSWPFEQARSLLARVGAGHWDGLVFGALWLVVAVIFVPMLDLLLAIVRRTRAGRSAFSPDKMHLHHRLLEIGHSHRRVVLLIYLWVGIVALAAFVISLLVMFRTTMGKKNRKD